VICEGGDVGVRDEMCSFVIKERFGSHDEGDVFDTTHTSIGAGMDRG
jgi:hypothetical protein